MRKLCKWMVFCALAAPAVALAQPGQPQPGQPGRPGVPAGPATRPLSPDQAGATQNMDGHFAVCLLLGNQEEVQLSQLAEKQAKHDKVKELAQTMAKDHQQFIQKLQPFAPQGVSLELGARNEREDAAGGPIRREVNRVNLEEDRRAPRDDARPGAAPGTGAGTQPSSGPAAMQPQNAMHKMIAVEREVAQNCLARTREELSSHKGDDFDQAFLGQQICAHIGMLAKLETFERHASPQLKPLLQEGRETTQKHLDHIKELMAQVSKDTASRSAAK